MGLKISNMILVDVFEKGNEIELVDIVFLIINFFKMVD